MRPNTLLNTDYLWYSRYMSLVILLNIILSASSAPGVTLPNQECVLEAHRSGFSNLKKVAVMPKDERYGIIEGASKLELNDDEAKWLRQVTGVVACKDKNGKLSGGSGTLFERNDQIVTSGHVFILPDGKQDDCYFQTRTDPPVRRRIKLDSKSTLYGTEDVYNTTALDLVIAKLDKPILKVKPVRRHTRLGDLNTQDSVLMVSSQMLRMSRKVKQNEPVVQRCTIRNLIPASGIRGTSLYTDCSATASASGSMMYVRNDKADLVGVGILESSGSDLYDNTGYNFAKNNFSRSLAFDGPLGDLVDRSIADFK